ncbi:MAG: Heme exporter protein C [Alphaproteobacteria bacterium MarineAlpha5_Bin9]|nr:MAG: Heme exporter protein C [Alphaproteobacteria bacterium MarineAlpha5_Bin9]|tara:strand:- start:42503 stop:43201 length:699 start_codon:yes stop_codon:yes gene_type:complete
MFKTFFNPGSFEKLASKLNLPILILSCVSMITGLIIIFYFSPDDYQQGSTVKIMYIHVPAAYISLMTFAIMAIYSIISLAFKMPFGFIINKALAPIGAVFTLICIVSGSLWGKPMWGTWWVWDARLTSVFILFITYILVILIRQSFTNIEIGEKISAVFVILGSINLPIIKFSVDWWNTLHQPASISKLSSPSIDITMLIPLLIMTVAFMSITLNIALISIRYEIINRKRQI